MRKFECNECAAECELTLKTDEFMPNYCLSDKETADWHKIIDDIEENAQTDVETKQLPDWVKVGAIGWNKEYQKYFEIIMVQHDILIDVKNFDNTYSKMGYGIFCEQCNEARKRPFNGKEMKGLVGKVVEDKDGNAFLVTEFIKEFDDEVEGFGFVVQISNSYYGKHELMKYYTVDGKPCYVLEHLENGEWLA